MPPKKVAPAKATKAKSEVTAPVRPTRVSSRKVSTVTPAPVPQTKKSVAPSKKRTAAESSLGEPATKKARTAAPARATTAATKAAPTKKAAATKKAPSAKASSTRTVNKSTSKKAASTKVTARPSVKKIASKAKTTAAKKVPAPRKAAASTKITATKKNAAAKKIPAPKKSAAPKKAAATKKAPAPKKPAAPKPAPIKKFGPAINAIPSKKLDVYVCGEGGAGELGLGALKFEGKKPIDVKRPRINHRLLAKDVGVVLIAVGGMHCAALTHDNRILTWGVNDQGALGRETTSEGKTKAITKDDDDSDSDSDDEDSGLNPSECEPREVDPKYFPAGTKFTGLVASDSATFAITQEGLVYGWGTFRGNDGLLGFRKSEDIQETPILIPELKKITALAAGTNHILALDNKGKVFTWGAGEQNQLARRIVQRTATGALIPREFGLKGQNVAIGCGDYHSFAVKEDGTVRAWGLNSYGECGIEKDGPDDNGIVESPTVVTNLKGFSVKQIDGGGHHSIAVTESGQVLTWGRVDSYQGGVETSKYDEDFLEFDESGKPRYLKKPAVVPNLEGEMVSAGTDSCLCITKQGKAYSWGFSDNYQTGQGDLETVKEATLIDNSAIRDKKLIWAGAGGQFSVFCGEAENVPMEDA